MAEYEVIVTRTELITFVVEADSAADAEDRYLGEGDEVASRTDTITIQSIAER